MKPNLNSCLLSALGLAFVVTISGGLQPLFAAPVPLLNEPVGVGPDFQNFANTLFWTNKLASFDAATGAGNLRYQCTILVTKNAFDNTLSGPKNVEQNEFPAIEYAANSELPFSVEFVTPRTIRIRTSSGPQFHMPSESLILAGPNPKATDWRDVEEDYRTNEIAINWNGALIYALAMFLERP